MTAALLVIDVQVSLVADETPNPEAILSTISDLVDMARTAGATVVWVTDTRVEPDPALHPSFSPRTGELQITKSVRSAFAETGLKDLLDPRGVDHVVICGMQSDACVDGTTRAAVELGYKVTLVSDAHTTHADGGRDWQAVVVSQNARLGGLESVTLQPSVDVSFR